MMTPQLTEQYGHVERVSVVRAILSSLACARTGRASNPKSSAAALPVPTLKNSRLDKPIEVASCKANHARLIVRAESVRATELLHQHRITNMLEPYIRNVHSSFSEGGFESNW